MKLRLRDVRALLLAAAASLLPTCTVEVPDDNFGFLCQGPDDCAEGFTCAPGQPTGRCVPIGQCANPGDCPQGTTCDASKQCVVAQACTADHQCIGLGLRCDEGTGTCFDPCQSASCGAGLACLVGGGDSTTCVSCSTNGSQCPGTSECEVVSGAASCQPTCSPVGSSCMRAGSVGTCTDANSDGTAFCVVDGVEAGRCADIGDCTSGEQCVNDDKPDTLGTCAPVCSSGSCASGRICVQAALFPNTGSQVNVCASCPSGCAGGPCSDIDPSNVNPFPGTRCETCTETRTCAGLGAACGAVAGDCGPITCSSCDGGSACVAGVAEANTCEPAACAGDGVVFSVPGFDPSGGTSTVSACRKCEPACGSDAHCEYVDASGSLFAQHDVACACDPLPSPTGNTWRSLGLSACGEGVTFGFTDNDDPVVAINPSSAAAGQVVVAWSGRIGGARRAIYLRAWDAAGGRWIGLGGSDEGDGISNVPAADVVSPSLVVTATGRMVIAYNEQDGTNFNARLMEWVPGVGSWAELSTPFTPLLNPPASLTVDGGGTAHLALVSGSDAWLYGGTTWGVVGGGAMDSALSSSVNQSPNVVFSPGFGSGAQLVMTVINGGDLFASATPPGGTTWSAISGTTTATSISQGTSVWPPVSTAVRQGQPVVAFACGAVLPAPICVLEHGGSATSTTWSRLPGTSATEIPGVTGAAPVAVADNSNLFVAYQTDGDASATSNILLRFFDGTWKDLDGSSTAGQGVSRTTSGAHHPSVAVGPKPGGSRQVCVAWTEADNPGLTPKNVRLRCHDL